MNWTMLCQQAIEYIENHITEELSVDIISKKLNISAFYFQKGFAMLCGITVSEYIRNRRLSLAGRDLVSRNDKIIDIAVKYGYENPDSFTKAFSRFHGVTPLQAKKTKSIIKIFSPLKIKLSLEGGYTMNYKIEKRNAFKVLGHSKTFEYDTAKKDIPMFWQEHFQTGKNKYVKGEYGINIDKTMGQDNFEYLIADSYRQSEEIPEGFNVVEIPSFTWAIFPCKGPMPKALQNVNTKIFSEWLPALGEYEFAAGYCIEYYDDPSKYPQGTNDKNYYCEIWIPIKQKEK